MKKIRNCLFPFAMLLSLGACMESYGDRMSALLAEYLGDEMLQCETIVLIPGSGCPGCVSAAERWVKDHVDDDGLMIVFTDLVSRKTLLGRLRHYGIDPETKTNIWIDEKNALFLEDYVEGGYPYVFMVDNGAVVETKPFMDYVQE